MFNNIRQFVKMYRYSAEEAAAISANGLFANTPIDSNDSPAGNNQQYCSVMNTLAIAHKRDPDYGCLVRYSFVKGKMRRWHAHNWPYMSDTLHIIVPHSPCPLFCPFMTFFLSLSRCPTASSQRRCLLCRSPTKQALVVLSCSNILYSQDKLQPLLVYFKPW
jgi:hypothetical protein